MINLKGHHGTNKKNFEEIKLKGFKITENGWFGSGVYFFNNDIDMALKWSKKKYDFNNIVIEITLNIKGKYIFDVRDPKSNDNKNFHKIREQMITQIKNKKIDVETSRKNFDNTVFNYIVKKFKKKVVLANSFSYDCDISSRIPNGSEICIVDRSIIILKNLKEVY